MFHIYTGTGKGKTTAALGLMLRALGWRRKVLFVQFFKGIETGEKIMLEYLASQGFPVSFMQAGRKYFIPIEKPKHEDVEIIRKGFSLALKKMRILKPDIVVFDEINLALAYNILDLNSIMKVISELEKANVEIIFTGRYAPKELIEVADLVTNMVKVKHYFDKGIKARKGIEY